MRITAWFLSEIPSSVSAGNRILELLDEQPSIINNDKLVELDVTVDHINRDTFKEKKNFFSYRRSSKLKQNDYGRCISVVTMI